MIVPIRIIRRGKNGGRKVVWTLAKIARRRRYLTRRTGRAPSTPPRRAPSTAWKNFKRVSTETQPERSSFARRVYNWFAKRG